MATKLLLGFRGSLIGRASRLRRTDLQPDPATRHIGREQEATTEPTIRQAWTALDIGLFEVGFFLVVVGTAFSARTEHPVLWLLVGPGTISAAFTIILFIRHGFRREREPALFRKYGPTVRQGGATSAIDKPDSPPTHTVRDLEHASQKMNRPK